MKKIEEKEFNYSQLLSTSSYAFLGLILVLTLVILGVGNFEERKGIEINSSLVDGRQLVDGDGPWITINLDDSGQYYIEGNRTDFLEIEKEIERKVKEYGSEYQIAVTIVGDKRTKIEKVSNTIDLLRTKFGNRLRLNIK